MTHIRRHLYSFHSKPLERAVARGKVRSITVHQIGLGTGQHCQWHGTSVSAPQAPQHAASWNRTTTGFENSMRDVSPQDKVCFSVEQAWLCSYLTDPLFGIRHGSTNYWGVGRIELKVMVANINSSNHYLCLLRSLYAVAHKLCEIQL